MSQITTPKSVRILAYGFAALPVGFGALRVVTTGNDFRYLATAIASLLTAAVIFRIGASRISSRGLLSTIALAASTLVGRGVAVSLGAHATSAVWFVTLAFSLCFTVGGMLGAFSPANSREHR